MSTINEVAHLAGVSLATVSRVMNGSDRVRQTTKEKVMAAMAELGYSPNSAAQSLAGSRSNTLGMVVSWLDGPFYGPVMSAVEEELRKHNKHVIIASGHGDPDQEKDAVNYLRSKNVDGLILLTEGLEQEYLNELSAELPIYLINQHYEGLDERNMWLDNELGGYLATKFLIDNGHTRILCASGQEQKQDARERVMGYRRAMDESGIAISEDQIEHTVFDFDGGLKAMKIFETRQLEFSAVFAGSDEMAIGVMEWARQKGIQVPEQLSIVGFDNQLTANYVHPRLTTMHFPAYDMAKACAHLAIREIYHKEKPKGHRFTPHLVERQSVAPFNK